MTAYTMSQMRVTDPDLIQEYRERAIAAIVRHGGRQIVRGATPEVVEGSWEPEVIMSIEEFPDADAARAFLDSTEYREAFGFRARAADHRALFLVAGLSEPSTTDA